MSDGPQSFEKHAKMVPLYHYWGTALVAIPTLYFGFKAVTDFSLDSAMLFALAAGVVIMAIFVRVFPVGVQDRVIRLEERLRFERLLPDDLKGPALELDTDLLIGLRFAGDDELPELTRRVLEGELADRKAVKSAIKSWRADHQRI